MSSDENEVRRFSFQSPAVPDRQWLEWFRDFSARDFLRIELVPAPEVPFHLHSSVLCLPGIILGDAECSAGLSRHLHERATNDDIFFVAAVSGDVAVRHDGEGVGLGGKIAVGRNDAAGTLDMQTSCRLVTIRLSRQAIEPHVSGLADRLTIPFVQESPAMRLLFGYAGLLMTNDLRGGPELQHLISSHIQDLAILAMGANRDAAAVAHGRGVRAARLAAMKTDILANLTDPNLSVASVAARHRVTPRYVHLLFEAEGKTFSEYVVGQRLTRAHHMLSDPRFDGETISAIALMVGFGDLSYFNRTFRRRFGASPSDVRAMARNGGN
jgi:AraC-like DNA-binding protein